MEDENVELPKVKFIRLKNGDDIICELVESGFNEERFYTVINPLKILYVRSQSEGYLQIAFMPWVFPKICDVQEFNLPSSEVLLVSETTDKMNGYYWDNLDTYISEYKNEEPQQEEEDEYDMEKIKEILEGLGLDKKVYH